MANIPLPLYGVKRCLVLVCAYGNVLSWGWNRSLLQLSDLFLTSSKDDELAKIRDGGLVMKMHHIHTLVSIIILLCFTSCKQPPQPPIKIGLSVNLSGTGGTAGEHIRDGALLAVDHINTHGGINGRPLELLIRDDENSDDGIQKADESLINEKADRCQTYLEISVTSIIHMYQIR